MEEKSDILKMQLGEALKNYYIDELTEANRHRPSTIKNIKAIFKVWIFRNTYDKEIQIPDSLKGKDLEGNEILLGEININQLKEFTKDWSNNYNPNSNLLTKIKPLIKNIGKKSLLLIFLG